MINPLAFVTDMFKSFMPGKLYTYVLLAVGFIASALSIAAYIATGARNAERLKQANATLEHYKKEARINDEVQRLDAATARRRLYDRWGRR
jgi:hypothetical protein